MREATWLKNEAFVLVDVYDSNYKLLDIAPRNILKECLKNYSENLITQIQFSFLLNKFDKDVDEKEAHPNSNKGMLTLDSNYGEILNEITRRLLTIGIPIQQKD